MNRDNITRLLRNEAFRLGFDAMGVSRAEFLEDEAPRLEQWLREGRHGKMKYMENYFDKRLDPRKLVEGARSVVSLLYNYCPADDSLSATEPKFSRYAYGEDYHLVIREKLSALLDFLRSNVGEVNGRGFVDSAPVMERAWAMRSGLGWVGKNTNVITRQRGSWYFLAELILDTDLTPDGPAQDFCGTCTRCIDACPTEAIIKPYVVDGSRCISYFTIELREEIPAQWKNDMEGWAFGCDICQEVCPWNRFSKPHEEPRFAPGKSMERSTEEWTELTQEIFGQLFEKSAVKRTGYKGLKRNLEFIRRTS